MRIAALVFGILGGVVGLIAALLTLGIGGLFAAFQAEDAGTIVGGGFLAILFAALGIVGGALALRRPGASAVLQVVAAVGGLVAISVFWTPSAVLFALGTVTALLGRRGARTPLAA
ncbi:MAG: hypothetical protein RMH81_01600 [Thermomicrobium sp.]|nr:hypothetical protein [Thermomicrobium sp.]